jgi:hypothetical protein
MASRSGSWGIFPGHGEESAELGDCHRAATRDTRKRTPGAKKEASCFAVCDLLLLPGGGSVNTKLEALMGQLLKSETLDGRIVRQTLERSTAAV